MTSFPLPVLFFTFPPAPRIQSSVRLVPFPLLLYFLFPLPSRLVRLFFSYFHCSYFLELSCLSPSVTFLHPPPSPLHPETIPVFSQTLQAFCRRRSGDLLLLQRCTAFPHRYNRFFFHGSRILLFFFCVFPTRFFIPPFIPLFMCRVSSDAPLLCCGKLDSLPSVLPPLSIV